MGKSEKGATAAPFFSYGRSYRFLPAFFFPPLAFFAMCVIPPFMLGYCASAPVIYVAAAWHAHQMSALVASSVLGMA